jgi:CHAD domain-containing protein
MSYKLAAGETEDRALRRCAGEQVDRAIAELTDGMKVDPVTAVHSARKALKKTRSVLRLGRGSLRSSDRRTINAALRDAGRRLSDARDAEVMLETVDDLAERYAGQLPRSTFDAVKAHLDGQAARARPLLTDAGEVVEELKSVRAQVDEWRVRRTGWAAIGDGLKRSYKRGRRAFRRAEKKPTTESFHAWRKRAKDLWYHLRVLEPVSPDAMHGYAREAHELSDLLGDEHDLAVLRESLMTRGAAVATDLDSVVRLIDHRRAQLQAEATRVGARVYAEKPKAFRRRIRAYWTVWRSDSEPPDTAAPVDLPGRVAAPGV